MQILQLTVETRPSLETPWVAIPDTVAQYRKEKYIDTNKITRDRVRLYDELGNEVEDINQAVKKIRTFDFATEQDLQDYQNDPIIHCLLETFKLSKNKESGISRSIFNSITS